jgi:acyl carrier protein
MIRTGSTKERVYAALVESFGQMAHLIAPDTNLIDALKMDSLDMVETVMAIEAEFEIEIPDEEDLPNTIAGIAKYVDGKLKQVGNPQPQFDPSTGFPLTGIRRFEVIDHRSITGKPGRVVVAYDMKLEVAVQDNGTTIKVFLSD